MGFLPENLRFRTPVTLVVILIVGMGFLGFIYWTEYNRSLIYQRKIAFLQGTISKVAKAEDEAEGREEDFQRELRKQKAVGQRMNSVLHQEIIRLNQKYEHDQDQAKQAIKSQDAIITEKEALISNLKQTFLKMQRDMADFQKNQSQLLEQFSLQSEKMEMLVRLRDKCYSQMNSIRQRISGPALSGEVAPAGGSPEPQVKGSKQEQPEVKAEAGKDKADRPFPLPAEASKPPSAVRIPIPPLKLVDRLKNIFIDTVKGKETNSETPKNISSEATVKGAPSDDEDEEEIDKEVKAAVERKQPPQKPKNQSDLLIANEKEEPVDREVNAAVEQKQPSKNQSDLLKPNEKEEPVDREVKAVVEQKQPPQKPKNQSDLLKPNEKEEAKKEEELMDEEVKKPLVKKPAPPLEDEIDLDQPNE